MTQGWRCWSSSTTPESRERDRRQDPQGGGAPFPTPCQRSTSSLTPTTPLTPMTDPAAGRHRCRSRRAPYVHSLTRGAGCRIRQGEPAGFIFRLNASTELAKKMARHWDTFGVAANGVAESTGSSSGSRPPKRNGPSANTTQIRFVFHHDKFADDDKLLHVRHRVSDDLEQ